ncbi:uncharacterized protein [Chironomus tepperi]|uniref:uncharacterized protein isoform X3 n=1 Tax=Chironomus tepperi TaxID=113505 RepID=UPI00391FA8E8
MLNCTDLACVLHHHHFYANLHHLKRHLDGHHDHHESEKEADGTGSDVNDPNNITNLLNDEDDPNDVWYILGGVIIAMLSVGIIIILVAVTISKLRKREESSHNTHHNSESTQPTQIVSTVEPVGFRQSPSSVWHFPPLPPQPNLYIYNASSQDALVHSSNEKLGFRGFRKQLSGRFKRLVSRKSHEPSPVIPPELKPQLKTIYVY